MRLHLTDLAVRKLPLRETGQIRCWDTSTPGFGLTIGTRAKTFMVMFGKDRHVKSIGRYPDISLSEARGEAKRLLAHNPHKKRTERLPGLVERFLEDCKGRMRPSSIARYKDVLKKAPDLRVEEATKDLAKTAHEIKAYKALYNFAIREELCEKNPFQHLSAVYGQRNRILTDDELQKLWKYEHKPFSDIIKLLILTGQRKNQIWKLDPSWIHKDTIQFPASMMKQGREHTIPFGDFTRQHLLAPFSFNGWSKAKVRIDKHTGVANWTIHDLRRTFATIHARLGTPIHIVEALLAHTSGQISGVTAIYVRHNWLQEMRQACVAYETYIQGIVEK